MNVPLEGIKVLDLTTALAGPLATLRLGDLGASVYKIEGPTAPDSTRNMVIGGIPIGRSTSSYLALNRNKRSLVLDLKSTQGRAAFDELVRQSDVLVTNYLTRTVEALGLDHARLRQVNPRLSAIYISAFSEDDINRGKAGIDLLLQAYSGLIYTGGDIDRPYNAAPVFAVDVATSHLATEAALAGLFQAARTGQGGRFDISMMTAALELQLQEVSTYATTGHFRKKGKESSVSLYMEPPYGVHETADGLIAVARSRLDLIELALDMPELGALSEAKPPETAREDMAVWRDRVMSVVKARLKELTTADALGMLLDYDVWSIEVRSYEDLLTDPGVLARLVHVEMSGAFAFRTLGRTVGDERGNGQAHFASDFGEHSRIILREFDFSDEQIDRLIASSVVRERSAVPGLKAAVAR